MFNENDKKILAEQNIDLALAERQIEDFKKGFPFTELCESATVNNGILRLSNAEANAYAKQFEEDRQYYELTKFIPASGAATRMFKSLFSFIEEGNEDKNTDEVLENIENFAFYQDLKNKIEADGKDIKSIDNQSVISYLLKENGLNYGHLPKGLLKFHKVGDKERFAFEEHLVEAGKLGIKSLHFTVSPEHLDLFKKAVAAVSSRYEKKFNISFNISFSTQKTSTNTIAVTLENEPFRDNEGRLVVRPGGHGALIANLNELHSEVVFIKNIDNVVPDDKNDDTILWKKVLAGLLFHLQQRLFEYLEMLDAGDVTSEELHEMACFAQNQLNINIPNYFTTYSDIEKIDFLFEQFNRPLRICGMVRNEGAPGGGPFWTINADGVKSLQIIESSQVDHDDSKQEAIFKASTHFNPVDLVCATKDFRGNDFNLTEFIDHDTAFISQKSKDGRDLKAMELPGLWNGSMAFWNTVFVEVPSSTFNPVKTVNDLLRPAHSCRR